MFITCTDTQIIKGVNLNGTPNCINNLQTVTCGGNYPLNSGPTTSNTYVQSWNTVSSIWTPNMNWTLNASMCGFTCNAGFHTENNGASCISNTQSCAITNGAGTQTWGGTSWGTCTPSSCNSGYASNGTTCVLDVCGGTLPSFSTANSTLQTFTKTWTYLTPSTNICTFRCNFGYSYNSSFNTCLQIIDGSCGTANGHTYTATDSSYGSYTQCTNGTASNTTFPAQGGSMSWTCSGQNGGFDSATCTASRSIPTGYGTCAVVDTCASGSYKWDDGSHPGAYWCMLNGTPTPTASSYFTPNCLYASSCTTTPTFANIGTTNTGNPTSAGGMSSSAGTLGGAGTTGYYVTSTPLDTSGSSGYAVSFYSFSGTLDHVGVADAYSRKYGMSVRCIKN